MTTKTFVVERNRWLRGSCLRTRLLDDHGSMCCLGFVCAQLGVPGYALLENSLPAEVAAEHLNRIPMLVEVGDEAGTRDAGLTREAVDINDDDCIADEEREEQLAELFAKHGYGMVFR